MFACVLAFACLRLAFLAFLAFACLACLRVCWRFACLRLRLRSGASVPESWQHCMCTDVILLLFAACGAGRLVTQVVAADGAFSYGGVGLYYGVQSWFSDA